MNTSEFFSLSFFFFLLYIKDWKNQAKHSNFPRADKEEKLF